MKRLNKLAHLVLGFAAGLLSGIFTRLGFEIINGRPAAIGGEALILPMIVLLLGVGFAAGKEFHAPQRKAAFQRGFTDGYIQGVENMVREYEAEAPYRPPTTASGQ